MKLSDGKMQNAPGIMVHAAQVPVEFLKEDHKLMVLVPCKEVRTKWDITRGVSLHVIFEAVRENVISVCFYHFAGEIERGPQFRLHTYPAEVTFEETDTYIEMKNGSLSVRVQKQGIFKFDFYQDGKWLTGSERSGMAYVTDLDYEADRWCDMNAMPPRPYYMEETYMREELSLDVGEHIYGLGERFTPFVKNGQDVEIWNKDGGTISEQAYKNIPFYLSDKGYGVLVNHPELVTFNIGTHNVRKVRFSVEGERMEYMVIGGSSPKEALSHYTALTGKPALPPAWSFGLWLSTSWTTKYDQDTVLGFIREMERRGIPLSVFHYDACWMKDFRMCNFIWDDRFGDVKQMLKTVKDSGVKISVWINPYVAQHSEIFQEGKEHGYFLHKKDGSVWQSDYFAMGMAIVDFTNPAACDWFRSKLSALIDLGVDVFKTDFAERIPTNVEWYDRSDPRKMHNYYTYLYNQTVYNLLKEKKGERDACVFARSATVGNQKFPVHWGGDNQASYVSMAESLRGGLSLCLSGFAFWAHDMAGFEDTATPDLYKRWSAFGMLSTHSRLHGSTSYRVPWNFDEESADVLRFFTRLKCSLMPYLFSYAVEANTKGIPEMRAMMLEFPGDEACAYLDRQYMLGERLLVAPIFSENGTVRFYVPDGRWTNLIDGEKFEGGHWYERKYDYFGLPLLVRPNTLLPIGCSDDKPDYSYARQVKIHAYELQEDAEAACQIYDEQGSLTLRLTALRHGDEITVRASGSAVHEGWSLFLHDISGADATDAVCLKEEKGVWVIPEAGVDSLIIKLVKREA